MVMSDLVSTLCHVLGDVDSDSNLSCGLYTVGDDCSDRILPSVHTNCSPDTDVYKKDSLYESENRHKIGTLVYYYSDMCAVSEDAAAASGYLRTIGQFQIS
ncbi:unnamed protein product [Hymenolepis diminuta]|uniref:Uncharacterized protein n=1 Tax=Hymenolepis diminuta TaxID=6216 RepID=A0A564YW29_HYMDI|nr:unnamed protein product [Hymenolepis diminuta]